MAALALSSVWTVERSSSLAGMMENEAQTVVNLPDHRALYKRTQEHTLLSLRLKLPIHSTLAKRRAAKRGDDPAKIAMRQKDQLREDIAKRLFEDVSWSSRKSKWESHRPLATPPYPVSPKTMPDEMQMSFQEHIDRLTYKSPEPEVKTAEEDEMSEETPWTAKVSFHEYDIFAWWIEAATPPTTPFWLLARRNELERDISMLPGQVRINDALRSFPHIDMPPTPAEIQRRRRRSARISYDDRLEVKRPYGFQLIRLPIEGIIAQRRACSRGEDISDVRRMQFFRLAHEMASRINAWRDVDVTFKDVDWQSPKQTYGRGREGEPVSPRTSLRSWHMTVDELEARFGIIEDEMRAAEIEAVNKYK